MKSWDQPNCLVIRGFCTFVISDLFITRYHCSINETVRQVISGLRTQNGSHEIYDSLHSFYLAHLGFKLVHHGDELKYRVSEIAQHSVNYRVLHKFLSPLAHSANEVGYTNLTQVN